MNVCQTYSGATERALSPLRENEHQTGSPEPVQITHSHHPFIHHRYQSPRCAITTSGSIFISVVTSLKLSDVTSSDV